MTLDSEEANVHEQWVQNNRCYFYGISESDSRQTYHKEEVVILLNCLRDLSHLKKLLESFHYLEVFRFYFINKLNDFEFLALRRFGFGLWVCAGVNEAVQSAGQSFGL